MAERSSFPPCTRTPVPYRITPSDREGPLPTEPKPHTCQYCNLIMIKEYEATLSDVARAIDHGCAFIQFCYEILDPKWGRHKDGTTLIDKVREASELENVKMRIGVHADEAREAVDVWTSTFGVPRFVRGIGSPKRFMVLAREGDPAAKFFPNRPINRVVRSDRGMMLSQIRARLSALPAAADTDRSGDARPGRLVDLGETENEISPSIIDVGQDWNQQYICLSYCWGSGPRQLTATRNTLPSLKHGFSYDNLPPTIQDTCLVTKLLGYRYIWIDALCIVQDDPNDQAREIPKMRGIYRGAILTICATRASTVWDGFLSDRAEQVLSPAYFQLAFSSLYGHDDNHEPRGSVLLLKSPPVIISGTSAAPLHCRGWTFQERVLSTRVLEFDSCHTNLQDEHTGESREYDHGISPTADNLSKLCHLIRNNSTETDTTYQARVWADIVHEYSRRLLTDSNDKLTAVQGLAEWYGLWLHQPQSVSSITNTTYLAGLWHHHLPEALLWGATGPLRPRPQPWRAPSWSWTSIDGAVYHPANPNVIGKNLACVTARVLAVYTDVAVPGDVYGRVKPGAQLVLEAPVFEARCRVGWDRAHGKLQDANLGSSAVFGVVTFDATTDIRIPPDADGDFWMEEKVWCAQVCARPLSGVILNLPDEKIETGYSGLVLMKSPDDPNVFRRLGKFEVDLRVAEPRTSYNQMEAWERTFQIQRVVIV